MARGSRIRLNGECAHALNARWGLVLVVVALASVCLAGCGGTDEGAGANSEIAETSAPTTETVSSDADESGGEEDVLRMAIGGIADSMDPANYQGRITTEVANGFVSTLMRYKAEAADPEALQGPDEVEEDLVESYTTEADGYTMTLRDAQSPAGNTVTSADVKWSFERAIALDPIGAFLADAASIDTQQPIEIIDDKTFKLRTTGPNALTLATLTWYSLGILDSTVAKEHVTTDDPWAAEWLATNSATFGPYQIESFTPGEEVRLITNPNYWRGVPDIERVVARAVPDSASRLQLIQTGDVDFVSYLTFDHFKSLEGQSGIRTVEVLDSAADLLALNFAYEPFADARVRKAISLAINRDELLEGIYKGLGKPALYQMNSAIPQPVLPDPIEYDPERAKELLAEAGYGDGLNFTLTINPVRPGAHSEQLAVLIQSQLSQVGVNAEIEIVASGADFEEGINAGQFQSFLFSDRVVVVDTAYYMLLYYVTDAVQNLTGYSNERIDELTNLMLETAPGDERNEYLSEAQEILAADVPWVLLAEPPITWAFSESVTGEHTYPTGVLYPAELTKD